MDNPVTTKLAVCYRCGVGQTITAPVTAFMAWESGVLIQEALPMLNAGQREMLISQTCDDCWTEMFGESEDDFEENWVNN